MVFTITRVIEQQCSRTAVFRDRHAPYTCPRIAESEPIDVKRNESRSTGTVHGVTFVSGTIVEIDSSSDDRQFFAVCVWVCVYA